MPLIHIPLSFWIWLGIILFLLTAAAIALDILLPERSSEWKYKYMKKTYLLTQPEHQFFDSLLKMVGAEYHVFPQIHLASILNHKVRNGQNWRGAFRHIDEKSVDFVLCDKERISPILAIELDDRTHERPDRRERDREVERILADVGLPLLRLRHDYSEANLHEQVRRAIQFPIKERT